MVQAKKKRGRTTAARPKGGAGRLSGFFSGSVGMLLTGIVIGAMGTTLWHGWRGGDSEVGSGIRRMMEDSSERSGGEGPTGTVPAPKPVPQKTDYDFFTVLPEIEVVVSEEEPPPPTASPDPPPSEPESSEPESQESTTPEPAAAEPESSRLASAQPESDRPAEPADKPSVPVREAAPEPVSTYMLQAGSFSSLSDADRLKARIALLGLSASIQKVTIQGRGDFHRVRLGPFPNYSRMVEADERLKGEGIQALRLKVSRPNRGA